MELVWVLLAVAFTGAFAVSAVVKRGGAAAMSRLELVTAALDGIVVMAIAHAMAPWGDVSTLLWFIPLTLLAVGTGGAALRWAKLPWLRADRSTGRRVAAAAVHLALLASVVVLVFG